MRFFVILGMTIIVFVPQEDPIFCPLVIRGFAELRAGEFPAG